jgi:hypothetical protein
MVKEKMVKRFFVIATLTVFMVQNNSFAGDEQATE